MTIEELVKDYDWQEAFAYAGKPDVFGSAAPGPFAITDVAEILHIANGENDGDNWVGVFRLKDGRYAWIDAGCDYTGWD